MDNIRWGIVGIGKIGRALTHQLQSTGITLSFFHPNPLKAESFKEDFPYTEALSKNELSSVSVLLLALPAHGIIPFLHELKSEGISLQHTLLVNLATVMPTPTLRAEFPELDWLGLKFMGHSEDLRLHGNALFVADAQTAQGEKAKQTIQLFEQIGKVIIDDESVVEKLNKLATYHAIKAAKELEKELQSLGYPREYQDRAIAAIAPEVMRSYVQGTMGHFAKTIADSFDNSRGD
ncbi:NAD(P)-binding domain-containing protein [Ammoniphilus sp. YIM 78166]|uniref:NAD(P)-binding domain-containing protein n=1 Tax=Ammoniphilus sp. YIM 78166 TaxID=1644106 RepID=UPI0010704E73|nr:NAD(P)-binding domain-containing protein [Ammoniphilus sp. YIM 78166]